LISTKFVTAQQERIMGTEMPCSATAEELLTDAGTKPSGMPQAPMSLREIAEAFVKHEDADVVGVIHKLLLLKQASPSFRDQDAYNLAFDIIDFVEAQNEG
jgi:hypothetical protein